MKTPRRLRTCTGRFNMARSVSISGVGGAEKMCVFTGGSKLKKKENVERGRDRRN